MKAFPVTINGKSIITETGENIINPASGKPFARMSITTPQQVDEAVMAARNAFPDWSALPDAERENYCLQLASVLEEHAQELAELLTQENGKPLNGLNGIGSNMEIGGAVGWTQYTASLSLPVEVLQDDESMRIEVHYKPLGVIASISPWNWPLLIAIWHVIPALRSGNTVVIKPSILTPLTTARFVELANKVLPAGVLNLVSGSGGVGHDLVSHPDVDKIIFTGSTPTGKKIMQTASADLKRLTLELGGNDAGIVLPDIDVKETAPKLFAACFHNNGQTCAALKRLYVHESVFDEITEVFAKMAQEMIVGDGLDAETQLGPLQNEAQLNVVRELTQSAIEENGTIIAGGAQFDRPGYFFQPTVVTGLHDGHRLVDEEQFGPVIPIIKYSDIDTVITRANTNPNGLGASLWSNDLEKATQLATRFESGSVWINDHGAVKPNAPFGGVKQSGIGVEFGLHGLKEYTSLQTLHILKTGKEQ